MITYFKAVQVHGASFYDSSFRWNLEPGGVTQHRNPLEGVSNPFRYLSVSTVATDCTGFRWPCRLLVVEPVGYTYVPDVKALPYKVAGAAFRTVEELPAWKVFGPNGEAVVAVINRAERLTNDEAERLAHACSIMGTLPWATASDDALTAASWSAAWDAADYAVRAAMRASPASSWSSTIWTTDGLAWSAPSNAAVWAALAEMVKDLITAREYETLMTPWRSVIGEGGSRASEVIEMGEITGSCACLRGYPCNRHPHGVYVCNCKKRFHGHIDRDIHWATCPSRTEVSND